MKVRFVPGVNFDLVVFTENAEIVVPPNSVGIASMALQVREGKDLKDPAPVNLKAIVSFEGENKTGIELPFTYSIKPVEKWTLKKSSSNIKVDADLKEWGTLDYIIPMSGNGMDRASFSMKYDNEMLYVAADVRDDKLVLRGSGSPWTQDYIGLCLNAESAEKAAMSVGKNWYKGEMYFLQTAATNKIESRLWQDDKLPEGSAYVCKANEEGYTFEWAIPLTYIREKQGDDWKSLRFNIMVGDKDSDEEDPRMYFWQPNWRGDENYLGSGMFFRD